MSTGMDWAAKCPGTPGYYAQDVVTVPREDWNVAASLANAWIRFPLVSEFAQNLKAWKALRSGEDGKEAGNG